MTSRWDRLELLLERASTLAPEERAAFLEREAGGDADLLAEAAALLEASPDAEEYLDRLREDLLGPDVQDMLRDVPTADDGPDPWVGRTVSHYEILDRVGGGGMGVIYRARDVALDRPVAIKFIAPEIRRDAAARDRFTQEARAASALDHPNICTIHEIAETEDGRLYIVMTAYDGETLRARLDRGPLPEDEALDLAEQVARALAAAHEHGIVHRDVKPANIIVTHDGVAKLLDFGLARSGESRIGAPGAVEGTVAYMSPEQIEGRPADPPSDVWALGVTLFEMLAGVRPFAADHPRVAMRRILADDPDLGAARDGLSPGTLDIVARALAKRPEDRFPDAREMLDAMVAHRAAATPGSPRGLRRALAAGITVAAVLTLAYVAFEGRENTGPVRAVGVEGVLGQVLWVDDNPANNEEVVQELGRRNVQVTTALDTEDGLRSFDPAVHQLVISDIGRYEGADETYTDRAGIDLLERLRAVHPDVKVALCTSTQAVDRYGREALAAGAVAVVDDCRELFR
ncbi:MAG TPA: protein kinase [Longimicrobiales bacterium]|nr:protein kinase [Longimicrobiales bacterium]